MKKFSMFLVLGGALFALASCDDASPRSGDVIHLNDVIDDTGPTTCQVDCDCPQGQVCASDGTCKAVLDPIYCCDKAGCPQGERCVSRSGAVSICAACVVDCDCPQGQACALSQCVEMQSPVFCCAKPGCPANQTCSDLEGLPGTCPRECQIDCDCPQGEMCSVSGICVQGVDPVYCCDKPACPIGEACTNIAGATDTCRECRNDCECAQGSFCSSSGLCMRGVDPVYCCSKEGCPGGEPCVTPGGQNSFCEGGCGNGVIDDGELCDGNCPTDCHSDVACITGTLTGSAATCDAKCEWTYITRCVNDDGCCPADCTAANDNDCPATCGNGQLDPGETCDGDCPTVCNDNDPCTENLLIGAADNCTAECVFRPITQCQHGDGCCPTHCDYTNDNDCSSPSGLIGSACRNDNDCLGNLCLAGWSPSGYCSKDCYNNADCGAGAHCAFNSTGAGICLKSCDANPECRAPEYGCYNRDGDANNYQECGPLGIGTKMIGDPCNFITECPGGQRALCLWETLGYRHGYCSMTCRNNAECLPGSHCGNMVNGVGNCVRDCATQAACRADGYLCFDADKDNLLECAPAATGTGAVGAACRGDWECAGGVDGFCARDSNMPGGYCSQHCLPFLGPNCPDGSHCTSAGFSRASLGLACVDTCTATSQCRVSEGYICTDAISEYLIAMNECWPQ